MDRVGDDGMLSGVIKGLLSYPEREEELDKVSITCY